jgi:hypothetical protein
MSYESFLTRYPDGENLEPHCFEFYRHGYIDGEMLQFQVVKSLEQQIQGHVLEVLKLREELKTLAASGLEAVKYHQAELAEAKFKLNHRSAELDGVCQQLATLRPAAEALKTAVELRADILIDGDKIIVGLPSSTAYGIERGTDPLAATIKAITRAAEAVKENEK